MIAQFPNHAHQSLPGRRAIFPHSCSKIVDVTRLLENMVCRIVQEPLQWCRNGEWGWFWDMLFWMNGRNSTTTFRHRARNPTQFELRHPSIWYSIHKSSILTGTWIWSGHKVSVQWFDAGMARRRRKMPIIPLEAYGKTRILKDLAPLHWFARNDWLLPKPWSCTETDNRLVLDHSSVVSRLVLMSVFDDSVDVTSASVVDNGVCWCNSSLPAWRAFCAA